MYYKRAASKIAALFTFSNRGIGLLKICSILIPALAEGEIQ